VGSVQKEHGESDGRYLYDDNTQLGIFFGEFPDKRKVGQ